MKYLILCSALLGCVLNGYAQEKGNDSLKTYQLGGVVVTATRSRIPVEDSPSPMEVIGVRDLGNSNGTTVADVLENLSSVFLKDRGATAALKTISMRGSGSEQVLVLVNGNRLNSFQNELADLSLLPMNDVERIEIVHGGSSALYGADALGGVINILTRQPGSDFHAKAEASSGSLGYEKYLLETQGGIGRLALMAGLGVERGRDDFTFHYQLPSAKDTTAVRADDDFVRRQFYVHGNFTPDNQSAMEFSFQNVLADHGIPGPFDPSTPSFARESDDNLNLSATYTDDHVQAAEVTVRTNFQYGLENDNEPLTFYKNILGSVNPQARLTLDDHEKLIIGGELVQGTLESPDFDSKITRVEKALYVSSESQFDFDRRLFDRISLYQTIRYDDISDVDFAVTPKLGVNIRLLSDGDVRLRSSFGQNFRPPSFNDLFYRGYSNPNLKPERSTGFDVGLLSDMKVLGEQNIEITWFEQTTDDRIVFDPTTYLPVNIGKVVSNGLEAAYHAHILDRLLEVGVNYSLTDARKRNRDYATDSTYDKRIIYVPENVVNLSVSLCLDPLTFNVHHTFVGERFITQDDRQSLPAYRVTNANVILHESLATWKFFLKAEVNNLFDVDYQVFQQYPMPGRSYRCTAGIEY
jgi:outer membrane cobalamin receptor